MLAIKGKAAVGGSVGKKKLVYKAEADECKSMTSTKKDKTFHPKPRPCKLERSLKKHSL